MIKIIAVLAICIIGVIVWQIVDMMADMDRLNSDD